MTIIDALENTGNPALALKVTKYLLNVYQIALDGCIDDEERNELKQAFSEALQTEI